MNAYYADETPTVGWRLPGISGGDREETNRGVAGGSSPSAGRPLASFVNVDYARRGTTVDRGYPGSIPGASIYSINTLGTFDQTSCDSIERRRLDDGRGDLHARRLRDDAGRPDAARPRPLSSDHAH